MNNNDQFMIEFISTGRGKAQCAPDPKFPNGTPLDVSIKGQPCCTVNLPYPAPECGVYRVECSLCELVMMITAAGRPDDPTTVTVSCKEVMALDGTVN